MDHYRTSQEGLSPRVRGNCAVASVGRAEGGSIPARAGKPRPLSPSTFVARVYPRACGETHEQARDLCGPVGLSPRVRGNRIASAYSGGGGGSIPARAGKPNLGHGGAASNRVYPRACGETW